MIQCQRNILVLNWNCGVAQSPSLSFMQWAESLDIAHVTIQHTRQSTLTSLTMEALQVLNVNQVKHIQTC